MTNVDTACFFLESNFLGLGKLLALGRSFSNKGSGYFLFIQDKSVAMTNFTTGISLNKSKAEVERRIGGEEKSVDGFTEHLSVGGLNLGYNFSKVEIGAGLIRMEREYRSLDEWAYPEAVWQSRVRLSLNLNFSDYHLYFDKGLKTRIDSVYDITRTDEHKKSDAFSAYISYGVALGSTLALTTKFNVGTVSGGERNDLTRLGGAPGYRGIAPATVWAEKYQAVALDVLTPVSSKTYGTWVLGVFSDNGRVWQRLETDNFSRWHAYGAGIYLFLKEVAIPGLGLEIGTKKAFEKSFASLTLGLAI